MSTQEMARKYAEEFFGKHFPFSSIQGWVEKGYFAGWNAGIEAASKECQGPDEGYLHGCPCRGRVRALKAPDVGGGENG